MKFSETMSDLTFQLIEGKFSPEEALEILDYILTKKINFHVRRDFQTQITQGVSDENALKRIDELREIQLNIKDLMQELPAETEILQLSAAVSISPVHQTEAVHA